MTPKIDVVIPAGGTISEDYARRAGTTHRALAPLGPKNLPVMQHVVNAVRDFDVVSQIIGVADPSVAAKIVGVDTWLTAEDSGPKNILKGLAAARPESPVLVCTSDLPLLTPEAIQDFLTRADASAEICVGLVRAEEYLRAYPNAPPSEFVRLRDVGDVTMSCVFRVNPAVLTRAEALLTQVFESRKSQWRTAALFGPVLIWHWMRRTLTLRQIVDLAESRLQCRVSVLCDVSPALAFDIDTAEDYEYAHAHLGQDPSGDFSALV